MMSYNAMRIGDVWFGQYFVGLLSAKPLLKPMKTVCQMNFSNKLQWYFNQDSKIAIKETDDK